jgi:hypothetical protein
MKIKPYYILVGKASKTDKFEMLFGDYDRAAVVQEQEDTHEFQSMQVLTLENGDNEAIMRKLEEINVPVLFQGQETSIDMMLQVNFPERIDAEYDDFLDCPEWRYLMNKASFTHVDAAELIIHVSSAGFSDDMPNFYDDVPDSIAPIFQEAKDMGMTWILFHLGQ